MAMSPILLESVARAAVNIAQKRSCHTVPCAANDGRRNVALVIAVVVAVVVATMARGVVLGHSSRSTQHRVHPRSKSRMHVLACIRTSYGLSVTTSIATSGCCVCEYARKYAFAYSSSMYVYIRCGGGIGGKGKRVEQRRG